MFRYVGGIEIAQFFVRHYGFGLRVFEKCFESSALQTKILEGRSTFGHVLSKHFSKTRRPNRVLTYVKSALKIRSDMFVQPSKIFVWGA
jgi:hypothetical protein